MKCDAVLKLATTINVCGSCFPSVICVDPTLLATRISFGCQHFQRPAGVSELALALRLCGLPHPSTGHGVPSDHVIVSSSMAGDQHTCVQRADLYAVKTYVRAAERIASQRKSQCVLAIWLRSAIAWIL